MKRYFTCDQFSKSYGDLKVAILAILANLGQLTRDIFRAINIRRNLFYCKLYGVWGDDFQRKFQILEKEKCSFHFITFNFLNVFTAPKTLKGSRNYQDFALIRAVLFKLCPRVDHCRPWI